MDVFTLGYVAAVLVLAAFVKGAIGLGFPPIAVPLIATFFAPRDAVAIVNIPNLVLTGLILRRGGASWSEIRGFWALYVVGIAATIGGTQLLTALDRNTQLIVLGLAVLLFITSNLLPVRLALTRRQAHRLAPAVGVGAGLIQGTTGSSSAVLAPFLLSAGFTKQKFVFLISLSFILQIAVQTVNFALIGVYAGPVLLLGLATLPPILLGLRLGFLVQDRIDQRTFNAFVLVFLFANGLYLILRGIGVVA